MEYTLSSQAEWSLEKRNPQIAEYLMLRDGRFNALFGVGISIVMSAINHGFELPPEELADTLLELQRVNPASSTCHTFPELMRSTVPAIVAMPPRMSRSRRSCGDSARSTRLSKRCARSLKRMKRSSLDVLSLDLEKPRNIYVLY
jgi:hypothetical protein